MQCYEDVRPVAGNAVLLQTLGVTLLVTAGFLVTKTSYDRLRRRRARATVVVVGAGPVGLTSALIAAHSGKADRVLVYEERPRHELLARPHQITLDRRNVAFLQRLGVDFDNIEGCWQDKRFITRVGVFQEYVLSIIHYLTVPVEVKLKCKFTRDTLKELDDIPGRLIVLVCDGTQGRTSSLLGVSDEFTHQSCRAYGSLAAIERPDQPSVPSQEIRVHNLTFDLNAFGNDCSEDPFPQGFHLKIFGSLRHRYMSLAVPKCESKLVKTLKVVLDQSIMRNIFQACFNMYKSDSESSISDKAALKNMKFTPRLFEIKVSQKMEAVAYIQDANLFVVTEGDAARSSNFHSGMELNLGMKGLQSLAHFIRLAAMADTEAEILEALQYKSACARAVTQEYIRSGIREAMYLS